MKVDHFSARVTDFDDNDEHRHSHYISDCKPAAQTPIHNDPDDLYVDKPNDRLEWLQTVAQQLTASMTGRS